MSIVVPAIRLRSRRAARGVPFLAGVALLITAAVLLPPVYLVVRALGSREAIPEILTQRTVVDALARTLLLTVTVTATCIAVAVPLAWLVMRTDLPGARAWMPALALPLSIPSFVGGYVMVSALGPGGMLQDLLEPLGVKQLPSIYGYWGSWMVLSALSYPYVFLQACAALRREDPALEEAARSLGRGAWAAFFHVTLPQLRPAISAGGILVALYVLSEFGAVSMLRYDTLTPVMYVRYTTAFDRGSAAVLGLPLIALAIVIVLIDGMTRSGARYHTRAQRREPKRLALGSWRWAALALCVLAAGIGAGVPVLVVCYWLIRGLGRSTTTLGLPITAVLHTVQVAAGGAILAGLATLPLAWLSVRHQGRLGRVLERLAYAGQALPAITIALALVFFSARYLSPIYQTVLVLIFAYGVRFLPEALGATRTALLQVNPNGEEAARSLGAGAARTFLRITAPQMLPGFSAGMLLVFLTAVKELPMTLLLSPAGYDTFATTIWAATSEAMFGRAALPSLVLLLLSGVAVLVMVRRERQAA